MELLKNKRLRLCRLMYKRNEYTSQGLAMEVTGHSALVRVQD